MRWVKRIGIALGVVVVIAVALAVIGALAAPKHAPAFGLAAPGHIRFGRSIDHKTLTIARAQSRFAQSARQLWFTSTLTTGAGSGLTYALSRVDGAAESTVRTQFVATANPADTIFSDAMNAGALPRGHYRLYLRHGSSVLARGDFWIVASS